MRFWGYVLLFLVLKTNYAEHVNPPAQSEVSRAIPGGFSKWLDSLVVKLPGKNITTGIGPAKLSLEIPVILCSHLGMASPYAKVDSDTLTAHIQLLTLSGNCSANWTLKNNVDGSLNSKGNVLLDLEKSSAARVSLQLSENSVGLPTKLTIVDCQIVVDVTNIRFSKDDAWFLNLFTPLLKDYVEIAVAPIVCHSLEDVVAKNATTLLHNFSTFMSPLLRPVVSATPPPVPSHSVNFTDNGLLGGMAFLVNHVFGTSGSRSVNHIVDEFTNGTGDILVTNISALQQEIFKLTGLDIPVSSYFTLAGVATIHVSVLQMNISGLNNWTYLEMLVPRSAYELSNHAIFGELGINVTVCVTIYIDSKIGDDFIALQQNFKLSAEMVNANVSARTVVSLNETLLSHFQSNTQLQRIPCLLWATNMLNFTELLVNVSSMTVRVIDVGASLSPSSVPNITEALSALMRWGITSLNPDIPYLFRGFNHQLLRPLLNTYISQNVGFNSSCPDPMDNSVGNVNLITTVVAFAASFLICCVMIGCWGVHVAFAFRGESKDVARVRAWFQGSDAPHDPTLQELKAHVQTQISDSGSVTSGGPPCRDYDGSLFLDPSISWIIRLVVPCLTVLTIPIIVSGHTSVGASSFLKLYYNGTVISSPPLMTNTFASTGTNMWDATVYPLAILIFAFSGVWPYVKLVGILFAWIMPAWILKPQLREWILVIIEQLGKWSLFDMFVVLLMVVSLHTVSYDPADAEAHTAYGAVTVKTLVAFRSGFFTFLTGTVLSLIISHLALVWHHRAAQNPIIRQLRFVERAAPTRSLWSENLSWVPNCAVRYTYVSRFLVAFAFFSALVLGVVGLFVDSFSFTFVGFGEEIFELLHTPTTVVYSTFRMIWDLPGSVEFPDAPGPRYTQVVLFIFIMIVPIVYIPAALVLWMLPLRPWMLRKLITIVEILNAWAALDVFTLAIIATLLELPTFSEFMLDRSCHFYTNIINNDLPPDFHVDTCLEVGSGLDKGIWVMMTAALLYNFAGAVLIHTGHNVLKRREEEAKVLASQYGADEWSDADQRDRLDLPFSPSHDKLTNPKEAFSTRVLRWLVWCLEKLWLVSTRPNREG